MNSISKLVKGSLATTTKNPLLVRRWMSAVSKTPLYDFHVDQGGKMVDFGGFLLPVQYADQSITNSHLFTRKSASLFDVSHMLQTEITGPNCPKYLETITTANIQALPLNTSTLTVFTDSDGGILDDLIVTKIQQDHLFVVSNAARKEHDQKHMIQALKEFNQLNSKTNIDLRFFEPKERALLALQGPKSSSVLQKLTNINLDRLYFMQSSAGSVAGVEACRVTRCGYTGEDGFEISMPAIFSVDIAREILKSDDVKLAGLGARDSLRLEAGLCLYGSDITEQTTPVEAALTWLVSKDRRQRGDFPGSQRILQQIKEGSKVKRVGLVSRDGPPARHDALILDRDGRELGKVTSGCPSPSLGRNVAMGYVPIEFSKAGTELALKIRGKIFECQVAKMPFVKANYYNKP